MYKPEPHNSIANCAHICPVISQKTVGMNILWKRGRRSRSSNKNGTAQNNNPKYDAKTPNPVFPPSIPW